MNCLGIECTAHTFGAGLVGDKGKVLSNERAVYTTSGATGMVPREVVKFHKERRDEVVEKALVGKVDLIAVSQGPGLGHTLSEGLEYSKKLAKKLGVPLVGVNHCVAHLEIGKLCCKSKDPVFLYVSGGNTQVIAYDGGKYRVFGETLDIGVGNLLDKAARDLGLGFPGGPKLYDLSLKHKNFLKMPYVVKGMDVCFSGLLTDFKKKLETGVDKADLAFSLQEVAFDELVEVSERALAHCGKKELLLGGGVAASKMLQEKARIMCEERGAKCLVTPRDVAGDNGAMIAWLGLLQFKAGDKTTPEKIRPYWRTDEVDVNWL